MTTANTADIRILGVGKTFGQGESAVRAIGDATLDMQRGDFISLLGPSGCGKTTTLRVIAGFAAPDAGRVVLHGETVNAKRPYERNIGVLFQEYALFPHLTVMENVAFGPHHRGLDKAGVRQRVERYLKLVRVDDFAQRYPGNLSGGQQQRVALARALLRDPDILILDEATSALDSVIEQRVAKAIMARAEGRTLIVIAHRLSTIRDADKILVLEDGRIVEEGSWDQLVARGGRFAELHGAQFGGRAAREGAP